MKTANFWIVKGNPRYPIPGIEERCGDICSFLQEASSSDWLTYRAIHEECKKFDPVFFWSSGKLRSIIAIGEILKVHSDRHRFDIKHHSTKCFPLDKQVNIREIRAAFEEKPKFYEPEQALYLKPSVVATIYRVTAAQAEIIIKLICAKNPVKEERAQLDKWLKLISVNKHSASLKHKP